MYQSDKRKQILENRKEMASSTNREKKLSDPSLTASFIEPYHKCGLENALGPLESSSSFPNRSVESFRTSTQRLRDQIENMNAEDEHENYVPLRRNGFNAPENYVTLAGDGLLSIIMDRCFLVYENRHEVFTYNHKTENIDHLGYLPLHGFYSNFGFLDGRFGCCVREPGVLCQLTPDGDFVVFFGPLEFARTTSPKSDVPVLAIYQVSPANCLFEKNCKKIPFLKCSPVGISLSPVSIHQRHYRTAMVTEEMEVRLWDSTSANNASLQLESVSHWVIQRNCYRNPFGSCIKFSPDGRLLSLACFMESEGKCACLILNASSLEPLCWMEAFEVNSWLHWIFPIFSTCGTKLVLCSYSDSDNKYDFNKSELFFYRIPITVQSLKLLCRVAILERVPSPSLKQLPLPNDLISFLAGPAGDHVQDGSTESFPSVEKKITCKCTLM